MNLPLSVGRCGDVPGGIADVALRRTAAVEHWLRQTQAKDDLDATVFEWLGVPNDAKREAARCFIELVRAKFSSSSDDEKKRLAQMWRDRSPQNPILQRLFYGDGLDRGLENACGFQSVYRLDLFLRIIGGDDVPLHETRWFCQTQLRFVLRDDPARLHVTVGYLWGIYAWLTDRDENWLRNNKEPLSQHAIHALQILKPGEKTALRCWLARSMLSTTKFFYQRTLTFTGRENAPTYLCDVPTIQAVNSK
jgi:hypothetical protein